MEISNVGIWLAFLAGLASFLSPCVLAMVPVYIGYLGGRSAGEGGGRSARWRTFFHGIAFVFGFSLVFIFFNIIAASLGILFVGIQGWLARIGGIIVIIFGVHQAGIYRIPFLDYERRMNLQRPQAAGFFVSFLLGVVFSAGWTPCVGPILGWILTFSLNGGSIARAVMLGTAYSLGMAVPFLAASIGLGWVTTILTRHVRAMRVTEIIMGVVMILAGILLFFDSFSLINTLFRGFRPIL